MIAFTFAAVQVILWQSADISVNIVSNSDEGTKEVSISVLNTAGATLLFYENDQVSGKIEYLSEDGWVEYCDVCYTAGNVQAVSPEYGGVFAELSPGEDWKVTIPEEKVGGMQNGTYRIKMTYITENNYNKYLKVAFNESKNDDESVTTSDISDDSSSVPEFIGTSGKDVSEDGDTADVIIEKDDESDKGTVNKNNKKEEFLAAAYSEVFYKNFEYSAPEKAVRLINDASEISQ